MTDYDDDYENPIGEYPDIPPGLFPAPQRIYNRIKSLLFNTFKP